MDTIRIILPALITLIFSLLFIWLIVSIVKKNIPDDAKEVKPIVSKIAWILTILILFFSVWWIVSLLSVNNVPRSTIDRTLNNQMRNSFEDRMIADTTKHKK
jgi:uncharacterized membrane protein SpoIIM required for sporulation